MQVLYDNASNFDEAMNSTDPSFQDRLLVLRQTWAGMQKLVTDFLNNMGFEAVALIYVDGSPLTVDRPTQLVLRGGFTYKVKTPAVFPLTLSGTWGTDQSLLVNVGDTTLRPQLAAAGGTDLIGWQFPALNSVLRTLSSRLGDRVSVADFGAVGDGVTNDTIAITNAMIYLNANGGELWFEDNKTYLMTSSLVMDTGVYTRGVGIRGGGRNTIIKQTGVGVDAIQFSTTQILQNSFVRDLQIQTGATAGHAINLVYGCTTCFFDNIDIVQGNGAKACVYGDWTSFGGGVYDTKFRGGSWYQPGGGAEAGVRIKTNGTIFNENIFEGLRCYNSGVIQFFCIEGVAGSSYWLINNTWKNINFEICLGGGFRFSSFKGCNFQNISFWDAGGAYTNNLIDMVGGSGYESIANTFTNVSRHGDSLGVSVRDVRIVQGQDSVFINCYTQVGDVPSYDWANKRVTVIGRMGGQVNVANAAEILPDISSFPLVASDTYSIGRTQAATLSFAAGFATLAMTSANTGIILTALNGSSSPRQVIVAPTSMYPQPTNTMALGDPSGLWTVVYAATGTINTSDARKKTEVRAFTDNEILASKALSKEIGVFKFLSAIADKDTEARDHIGMTVQRAIEIMRSNGLDPFGYGFICHDAWEETAAQLDADGKVTVEAVEAGDSYGFRMDELMLFIARGFEARLQALEE